MIVTCFRCCGSKAKRATLSDAKCLHAEEWEGCAGTEAGADGCSKAAGADSHCPDKGPAAHARVHAAPWIHPGAQRAAHLCDACQAAAVPCGQEARPELAWKVGIYTQYGVSIHLSGIMLQAVSQCQLLATQEMMWSVTFGIACQPFGPTAFQHADMA